MELRPTLRHMLLDASGRLVGEAVASAVPQFLPQP